MTFMMKNSYVGYINRKHGVIIYAKTSEEFQPANQFSMGGNKITVGSLDLNLPFNEIAGQLEKIVTDYFAEAV